MPIIYFRLKSKHIRKVGNTGNLLDFFRADNFQRGCLINLYIRTHSNDEYFVAFGRRLFKHEVNCGRLIDINDDLGLSHGSESYKGCAQFIRARLHIKNKEPSILIC